MIWSRDIVWYMYLNIIISATLTKKIKLFKKKPTYFLAIAAINTTIMHLLNIFRYTSCLSK